MGLDVSAMGQPLPTPLELSIRQCQNVLKEVVRINTKGYKGLDLTRPPLVRKLDPGQAITVWMSSPPLDGVILMAKASDTDANYDLLEGGLMSQLEDLATKGLELGEVGRAEEIDGIKWMFARMRPKKDINEMHTHWDELEAKAIRRLETLKSMTASPPPVAAAFEQSPAGASCQNLNRHVTETLLQKTALGQT